MKQNSTRSRRTSVKLDRKQISETIFLPGQSFAECNRDYLSQSRRATMWLLAHFGAHAAKLDQLSPKNARRLLDDADLLACRMEDKGHFARSLSRQPLPLPGDVAESYANAARLFSAFSAVFKWNDAHWSVVPQAAVTFCSVHAASTESEPKWSTVRGRLTKLSNALAVSIRALKKGKHPLKTTSRPGKQRI